MWMTMALAGALGWNTAVTPPMGFNTWNLYHCSVTGDILIETAKAMVATGLKDSGYNYVNSDDCWMLQNRSATAVCTLPKDRIHAKNELPRACTKLKMQKLGHGGALITSRTTAAAYA